MSKVKKEEAPTQAVATTAPQGVSKFDASMHSALAEIAGSMPLVHVRQSILKVRRIKLCQKMSKAVDSGLGQAGDFLCENRETNYGPTLQIIPLMVTESSSLLFNKKSPPRKMSPVDAASEKDGAVLCFTDNLVTNRNGQKCTECPFGEFWNDWGPKDAKRVPGCHLSLDLTVLVRGEEGAFVYEMNFRKNNHKAARKIVDLMANDPRKVPFGSYYTINSVFVPAEQAFHKVDPDKVSKTALSVEEIKAIIPIVKELVARKKEGSVEVEPEADYQDSASSDTSDDLPI